MKFAKLNVFPPVKPVTTTQCWPPSLVFKPTKTGYVHDAYLTSDHKYSSVSLAVPSYKQYDSRWASLTLGSSGKTMKQIGCLTTSIAMTESYRKGSTITPTNIRNNSSYTSNGSLYWPSNYTTSTASGYLSTTYNEPLLV